MLLGINICYWIIFHYNGNIADDAYRFNVGQQLVTLAYHSPLSFQVKLFKFSTTRGYVSLPRSTTSSG